METGKTGLITNNTIFLLVALATGAFLTMPLIAMRFTNEMNWTPTDFVAMGALIFGASSLFALIARRVQKKHRRVVAGVSLFVFLWLWAELAVGVLTNWGS